MTTPELHAALDDLFFKLGREIDAAARARNLVRDARLALATEPAAVVLARLASQGVEVA